MRALWLANQQLTYRKDVSIPVPQPHEALVKVLLAGICATDIQLTKGYYPYTGVLGHEFVGQIMQAPDAPERIGERVVGEINIACGHCQLCTKGLSTHCENRSVLGIINKNGAFAEYLTLPLKNLIAVPDTVSNEVAIFTEPLAAALQIQQQLTIQATDRVLIIGAGRLGQLIAQTIVLTGCDLKVVARYPKQQQCLEMRGIHWILERNIAGHRFDIVIEATGSENGFLLAQQTVRPRGTIVLKSTFKNNVSLDLSRIIVSEVTVIGSRCGDFRPALRLLAAKLIDPSLLIDKQYPLEQGESAFEAVVRSGSLKILLIPNLV